MIIINNWLQTTNVTYDNNTYFYYLFLQIIILFLISATGFLVLQADKFVRCGSQILRC